tara:strand:- start:14208 stop:14555 length:348 start_codon:yes stop_codon:yes gene_type:complete
MNWKYNHDSDSILEALNITNDIKILLLTIGPKLEKDTEIDSDSKFIEAFLKQVKETSPLLDTPQSIFNIGFILGQFLSIKEKGEQDTEVIDEQKIKEMINLEKIQETYDEKKNEF